MFNMLAYVMMKLRQQESLLDYFLTIKSLLASEILQPKIQLVITVGIGITVYHVPRGKVEGEMKNMLQYH